MLESLDKNRGENAKEVEHTKEFEEKIFSVRKQLANIERRKTDAGFSEAKANKEIEDE